MNYEMVTVAEKNVEGIEIRTENKENKAMRDIQKLWQDFFENGKQQLIRGRVNGEYIGLYTDYEGDFTQPYSYLAGCETDGKEAPAFTVKKIHAGRYAKFVARGDMDRQLGAVWNAVWSLPLKRTYVSDYEEYFTDTDGQPKEIHVYIGVEE